ncbi:MAG: hypothetical protein PSV22_06115 [Pseudolabrys sp.]|nr:hypothetical protein [Pseudolabrys sp.]
MQLDYAALRARLRELAAVRSRFGYRTVYNYDRASASFLVGFRAADRHDEPSFNLSQVRKVQASRSKRRKATAKLRRHELKRWAPRRVSGGAASDGDGLGRRHRRYC